LGCFETPWGHADSVVFDLERHRVIAALHANCDLRGVGVAFGVEEKLAHKREDQLIMRAWRVGPDLKRDPQTAALGDLVCKVSQRRREPLPLERRWVEVDQPLAELRNRIGDSILRRANRLRARPG